jgi:hypothetical protein
VNFHILSHAICAKLLASIAGDLDEPPTEGFATDRDSGELKSIS